MVMMSLPGVFATGPALSSFCSMQPERSTRQIMARNIRFIFALCILQKFNTFHTGFIVSFSAEEYVSGQAPMYPIGMFLKYDKSRRLNQPSNRPVRHYGHAPPRPDHPEQLAQTLLDQQLLGPGHDLGRSAVGRVQDGSIYRGSSQRQALGVTQHQAAIQALQVA